MADRTERSRSKKPDLPDWAMTLWEAAGEPDLSELKDVYDGPLIDRHCGIRRDDLVEILLDVRALPEGMDPWIRGRILHSYKSSIELLTDDGKFHYIARDVTVDIQLITHLRPPYLHDRELLDFEREDMKRRNEIHEKVEKASDGGDTSHVWG